MSISYEARQIGKVTILDVSRPIDVGVPLAFGPGSSVSLQELVCDFVQRGHVNIVLNLQNVVYIDSTGIAELVGSVTTLRKQGGDLKVVDPGMVLQKLLRTTKVDTVVDVKPDEASALQAFTKAESSASPAA